MNQLSLKGRKILYKIQNVVGITEKEFRMFFLISCLILLGSAVRYAKFYSETKGNPAFVEFDAEFRRLTARADSIALAEKIAIESEVAALPEFQPQPDSALDLNHASSGTLQKLPGVGPSLAAAILKTRTQLGEFQIVDDLLLVSGIGAKKLEKLRPLVRIGPSVTN